MRDRAAILIGALGIAAASAAADEVVVANDSFAGPLSVFPCPCFAENEEAAVWLNSPCDGSLVAVQVFWDSLFGGEFTDVGGELIVYRDGDYPVPGEIATSVIANDLDPGDMNEYRFLDSRSGRSAAINLEQGERFVVSFRFDSDNLGILDPSIAFDFDGATFEGNSLYIPALGWLTSQSQGVEGDWVIRAVVNCNDQITGACCLPSGACVETGSAAECAVANGLYRGDFSLCAGADCPTPTACVADITGDGSTTLADFDVLAGNFGAASGADRADGDLTGDGAVSLADFHELAKDFGCSGAPS